MEELLQEAEKAKEEEDVFKQQAVRKNSPKVTAKDKILEDLPEFDEDPEFSQDP